MKFALKEISDKIVSKFNLIPVILSGGSGTRLWPLSRSCYPKQYLNLDGDSEYSLLQNTFLRLKGLTNLSEPMIICNEEQRFIVAEQMRLLNIYTKNIILEPFGKNTGPAIALAALEASKHDEDALLLVLSADHQISDPNSFRNTIEKGLIIAQQGRLVTFGIIPNKAETGYGYIESFEELSSNINSSRIKRFVEKPSKEIAEKLIKDKHYSWNSGIFLFKASTIIKELNKFEPEIIKHCKLSINESKLDFNFKRINKVHFKKCPSIPIDIAVMEKTDLGTVLKLDAGWSDIGNWQSIWENSKKDSSGNSFKGQVIVKDSKKCYLRSENKLVVGIGIKNLIVIETSDVILIADKNSSEALKELVKELEKRNLPEVKVNSKMFRPWGNYTSIENGSKWQVKKLEIKPGASLSLQKHIHRSEHWVVVDGTAQVEIDSVTSFLEVNESIYVPVGSKHRLSNPLDKNLILIEVQSGSYLGEDDIIRFDDVYGREKG